MQVKLPSKSKPNSAVVASTHTLFSPERTAVLDTLTVYLEGAYETLLGRQVEGQTLPKTFRLYRTTSDDVLVDVQGHSPHPKDVDLAQINTEVFMKHGALSRRSDGTYKPMRRTAQTLLNIYDV